jgi:hypothetical protein
MELPSSAIERIATEREKLDSIAESPFHQDLSPIEHENPRKFSLKLQKPCSEGWNLTDTQWPLSLAVDITNTERE